MAQTGRTSILIYGSTVAGNTPAAGNLTTSADGIELAINAADGKLFYKDSGGNVQVIAGNGITIPQVIDVNSSSAALRITQTGTGNALVVEDSANPDSSPFVVNAGGKVFVGATAAENPYSGRTTSVEINSLSSTAEDGLALTKWSNTNTGDFIVTSRSRGSLGVQTILASGDTIGGVVYQGSDGTGFIRAAEITAAVDGTPGINDMPGRLVFSTTADGASSPTERMRIDSAGNLGLGVTPSAWGSGITALEMPNSGFLAFANSSGNISTNTYYDTSYKYKSTAAAARYGQAAGAHLWFTAPSGTAGTAITFTQAMTLDASGRLLLGTTSSITASLGAANVQIAGATQSAGSTENLVFNTTSSGPVFELGLSKNATVGSHTIVASGNNLGSIRFTGSDGTAFIRAAQISAEVDGTPGINDMPGRLVFSTTADGASSPTERMRIDRNGLVTLATALPVSSGGTGQTSYTDGQLLIGNSSGNTLTKATLTAGSNITITNGNGSITIAAANSGGDVVGPASSVSGNIATFNGTTGKLIQDSGKAAPTGDIVGTTDTQTLTNKTISQGYFSEGYTEEIVSANTGTAYTIDLLNGSVQILTLTGNCTFTFPTATAGRGFTLLLKQDATGSRTVTWPASVKWPSNTAPTITATALKADKYVFVADGTNWIGSNAGQNYTV